METPLSQPELLKKKSRMWPWPAAILLLLLFAAGLTAAYGIWAMYTPLSVKDAGGGVFRVERGEGVREIGQNLEQAGYIRNETFFEYYAYFTKMSGKLQAGEYRLRRDMNIPDIINELVSGNVFRSDIDVTFPEGLTAKQMEAVLVAQKLLQSGEFLRIVAYPPAELVRHFAFLANKPPTASLEGYLFPDTYRFRKDARPDEILEKILTTFDKKLTPDLWRKIQNTKYNIHDTVTMASLIEKEVPESKDRRIVSGILWKRIEIGMPLQVDATIAYITGKKTGEILFDDLKVPSPYNTYLNRGLPSGPVANPGLDAIEAALSPEQSPYLYYLSKPTGETVFSRTLEGHNAAKARYLK